MKKNILTMVIVFFLSLFVWALIENKALKVTEYTVDCSSNPELSGFTIVQISDLHNERFGESQQKILQMVEKCKPDIIAITGDFIDCRNPNVDIAMEFVEGAVKIAPVYYVPGNHESWVLTEYEELCQRMETLGVHLMADHKEAITYQGTEVICLGVKDPDFYHTMGEQGDRKVMEENIEQFDYTEDEYTLLLSHRPELFEVYKTESIDLALSGHAHGGQFRLPFLGGLAAPDQGILPKYDAGHFQDGTTNMIVSRGIGNSIIPLRFNNPPEVVVVILL